MVLVRQFVWLIMKYNVQFKVKVKHVPGKDNVIADKLSRFTDYPGTRIPTITAQRTSFAAPSHQTINAALTELIASSLNPQSRSIYKRNMDKYLQFCHTYFAASIAPTVDMGILCHYIAYLHLQGLSASTVRSAVSSLNFIHQLAGGQDFSDNFILKKVLSGVSKSNPSIDTRLPITKDILVKLCQVIPHITEDPYLRALFKSMFLLAFYAFLRVGEITVTSRSVHNPNLLNLDQISIDPVSQQVRISFNSFKHKSSTFPFLLNIPEQVEPLCLHKSLAGYLSFRGFCKGPLFLYRGAPVTRSFFTSFLSSTLKRANLSPTRIKSHSFRIGAATTALQKGFTHEQIQQMGRWKSGAFSKYLRVGSFTV